MYSYAALMIYSCAGYALALLIAVDIPHWSTRLCRPEALSLEIYSLRYTYNGTRRVRQLALGCESN